MDIDTMKGKELGIALAKEVMGWQEWNPQKIEAAGDDMEALEVCYPFWRDVGLSSLMVFFIADTVAGTSRYWAPWENIADAWEVVEKEATQRRFLKLTAYSESPFRGGGLAYWGADFMGRWGREAFGDRACIAICRASLKGYGARSLASTT